MYRCKKGIRCGVAMGRTLRGFCGLPPGCPFATRWMACLTHRWRSRVQAQAQEARVRCWVDDCTGTAKGEEVEPLLRTSAQEMATLERDGNMRVNRIKSGALVSHSDLRAGAEAQLAPVGVGVRKELKDLGGGPRNLP